MGDGRNTSLSRDRTTSAEAAHGSPSDTTPAGGSDVSGQVRALPGPFPGISIGYCPWPRAGRVPRFGIPIRERHTSVTRTADAIEHNLHTSFPRNPPPRRQNKPICARHPGPNVETQPANIRQGDSTRLVRALALRCLCDESRQSETARRRPP